MRTSWIAAVFPLLSPLAQAQPQDVEWVEVRFHRVHLRNGNFIDGTLDRQNDSQVVLRMRAGEMMIRRDSIDRVEFMKLRSLHEKPRTVPAAAKVPVPETAPKGNAGAAAAPAPAVSDTLKERVSKLLERYRKAPQSRSEVIAEMVRLGDDAALGVAAFLEPAEGEMRGLVAEILTVLKDRRSVPWLAPLLAHADPELRAHAVSILAVLEDPSVVYQVRPLLRDAEPLVREGAIRCLQQLDDVDSLSPLGYLTTDPNASIRARALTAVTELGRRHEKVQEVVEILVAALDRARGLPLADVAYALGRTGQKDAWPALARLLDEQEPKVRSAAVTGLASLAAPEAGDAILRRMDLEDDKRTRLLLGSAASRLKLQQAIPTFIFWLTDLDPDVQSAAASHLASLTKQTYGSDAARWRAWWEQVQPR